MILADFRKCYIPCGQKVAKNSTFTKKLVQVHKTSNFVTFKPDEVQGQVIFHRML